jgi:heme a synthase
MSTQDLQNKHVDSPASQWPHRWAWALACGVFPLIWIGGLVTTYEAGMSVPDWPTTFGSWFYPLQKWLYTISDKTLEHSHRTIAQIDGIIAIILIISIWRWEPRKSVRWLGVAIVLGLISQGVLGGFRVVLDDRVLARIHGCAAPLIFALCTAMVTVTSRAWRGGGKDMGAMNEMGAMLAKRAQRDGKHVDGQHMPKASVGMAPDLSRDIKWFAAALCGGLYVEIVLGAQFRHPLPDVAPVLSYLLVWTKVNMAAFLIAGVFYCLVCVLRQKDAEPQIVRRVKLLAILYCLQLVLAGGTWISNFGWPKWFTDNIAPINYTVVQNGRLQIWLTTAHAAVGSLCFVAALSLAMWTFRRDKG